MPTNQNKQSTEERFPKELLEVWNSLEIAALNYARRLGVDSDEALGLYHETLLQVTKSEPIIKKDVTNIPAYIFKSFKNLVFNFVRKHSRTEFLGGEEDRIAGTISEITRLETNILLSEIIHLMKKEERFIFKYLCLGYKYRQIEVAFQTHFAKHLSEDVLRSKFHKEVLRLTKLIQSTAKT